MSVTSCPALVSMPPTTLPIAPAPMMPIRIAMVPSLLGALSGAPAPRRPAARTTVWPEHDNLNRHDLRLRSSRRPPANRQLQVAEVRSGRLAALGGGRGF